MKIRTTYLITRIASPEQVMTWAEDAYANGEINRMPEDGWDAMQLLEDAGDVAFDYA